MAAVNTANNLVYLVVSALLGLMGISGFFGRSNLAQIDVRVDFPREIYATAKTPVRISVTNGRRFLPIFLLRVKVRDCEAFIPFLDAGHGATQYVNMTFQERGEHTLGLVSLSSVFPFNFFTRYKWYSDTVPIVVFPKLQQCRLFSLHRRERWPRGEFSSDKTGYESDIMSIREYVHGDPLKYINWKATAKTGELKTKELSSLAFAPVIIDFDSVDIDDVEEKISCIAFTIVQCIRKNVPVGMKVGGVLFKPTLSDDQKSTMLKELALYGLHP